MTRAYIKLDPKLPERKDYYPDGPWRAYVETLCYAAHQDEPGRFKNEKVLRALLGPRGRWIAFLVEQGDLTPSSLGFVYVQGWEQWQEGKFANVAARMSSIESKRSPMTPAERAFNYRQRQKAVTSRSVTADASQEIVTSRHAPSGDSPDVTFTKRYATERDGSKERDDGRRRLRDIG